MVDRTKHARHFIYKHPLFRQRKTDGGIWYEESVYYLWFEYLRRNEKYKAYCETKEGVDTKTVEKLYKDFGDIYNIEFKEWWNKRGAELFCEQVDLQRVEEISNVEEFRKHKSDNVLTLAIPLNKPKVWVENQIKTKLNGKRDKLGAKSRMGVSTAKYPIHTTADIKALKRALEVWDLYIEGNRSLVQCAHILKIESKSDSDESRRNMAFRLNKTAKQMIQNVGKGKFPQHKVRG